MRKKLLLLPISFILIVFSCNKGDTQHKTVQEEVKPMNISGRDGSQVPPRMNSRKVANNTQRLATLEKQGKLEKKTFRSVEEFVEKLIKEYNNGSLKQYGDNWIPSKFFIKEHEDDYKKYILLPSLETLDEEIEKATFESVIFPTIDVWDNSPHSINTLAILTYLRIIEKTLLSSGITEEVFKKMMSYKQGLLRPRGKIFLAVLDYVDQDTICYRRNEPGATYEFLKLETLLNYYSKGVSPNIIFPMIIESFYYHNFEPALGYKILETMKGHSEQRRFAEKLANGLEYLRVCKKSRELEDCPGPNPSLIEKIEQIQRDYGPFKLRDFSNENCPCPGE
jgi:hypothetical protein